GTSDPYVKFKISGKEVFRSRTIHKNLNPVWDEKASLLIENLREPLYVKQQSQSLRLVDLHRKAQLWRGIVSLSLIEGRDLKPMDNNGLSDPYVKFRLGHQKYKSKVVSKTLSPQWREQFDFHLYEERGGVIDITVWDKDAAKRDDFMGRCQIDLSALSKEHTHKLELHLEEGEGLLVLLVTLTASATVSISDLSVNILEDSRERQEIVSRYVRKSDPFCVVELGNDRLQTHTVYKNLNPEWNKVFTFTIKDIHSVLEVTVYDEDRDRSADFLGKVAIPLLFIQNGEQRAYVLKNKQLTGPTKGVIYLEIDVIFNAVKAGIRTLTPIEQKYIEEEPRVSKQLLLRNFNRVKRCIVILINAGLYINSCLEWDSPQRSLAAFLLFLLVVWNFEMYMIPLMPLLPLAWNYFLIISGKDTRQGDMIGQFLPDKMEGDSMTYLDILQENECINKEKDTTACKAEEEYFYRGGKVTWLNFYLSEMQESLPFIKRDKYEDLNSLIKKQSKLSKSLVCVNLFHYPGCGGTTLAKHVLWDLRKTFKCAVLNNNFAKAAAIAGQVLDLFMNGGQKQTVLLLVDDLKASENIKELQKYILDGIGKKTVIVTTQWL
ncbi:UNVERIFIED_CONTAM: hypothetical protein FKN15_044273, partial [Acipenser sinensis]